MEITFNQKTNDSETKGLGAWYTIPDTNTSASSDNQKDQKDKDNKK